MRIRAKLRSRRLAVDVTGSDDTITIADVIRCVSTAFNLENETIGVSLNGEVFLGPADGNLDAGAWGLVQGDLIHIQTENEAQGEANQIQPSPPQPQPMNFESVPQPSNEPEQSSQCSSSEYYSVSTSSRTIPLELMGSFPHNICGLVRTFAPHTPCQYLALVSHFLFTEAGFLTPPSEMFEPSWSGDTAVIRLPYHYKGPQIPAPDKAPVMVTIVDCDHFVTVSAQVTMDGGPGSYFSMALQVSQYIENNPENKSLSLVNQSELVTRFRDEILEKLRQDLHSYFGLMPVGLLRLPNELQFRILRFLDAKSLCRMEQCCSLYRHLSRAIWRHLFQRDYQAEYERLKDAAVKDWKMVYQESFQRAKALEEARMHSLRRTETFAFHEDWPPDVLVPNNPMRPLLRPPVPGMLGGAHDIWPTPLMPPGRMPDPFRPWFRRH